MIEYSALNEAQKKAVNILDNNHIGLIVGGPGTGKTTVLQHILKRLDDLSLSYVLAAPTGKASKRMMESTGKAAFTIHKILEPYMQNGQFKFQRNEDRPIEQQVLILDECSMIDTWLMTAIMNAITPEHRLLLLGDNGQLPSIGCGAVLRDFIKCDKIPKIELTEIHRNSGDIAHACQDIKAGRIYTPSKIIDIENGLNNRHLECGNEAGILTLLDKCYDKFIGMGYNPIWDIQVLSPINDRGVLSCKGLNSHLQGRLNIDNPNIDNDIIFRINDKVINIKNQELTTIDGKTGFIVNGDMGTIEDFNETKMIVRFDNPERVTALSKKNHDLILAYACTVHRYQGSECPICIIPVHKSISFMMDRPWIYTAISRASVACITIGEFAVISNAISRTNSMNRKTFLKERIIENHN